MSFPPLGCDASATYSQGLQAAKADIKKDGLYWNEFDTQSHYYNP